MKHFIWVERVRVWCCHEVTLKVHAQQGVKSSRDSHLPSPSLLFSPIHLSLSLSLPFSLTLQITMLKFILPSIFILGPPNKINMFQSSIQQPNSLNHSRRWKIYHCQNCQGTDKRSNLLGRLKTTKKLLSPVSHANVQDHLNFFKIISPNFYLQKPDKCGAKVQ